MKTIKFSGKLFLEKTAIAQLDDNQLASIIGGGDPKKTSQCPTATCSCSCQTCWCTSNCGYTL